MRTRIWTAALGLLLLVVLATGSYLYWQAREAEPLYDGELILPGLQAPAIVTFGPYAVPHIEARSEQDLFQIQGYVLASERMWQMDLMRRLAKGELAAVLGEDLVPVDRLFRTLGLARAASRSLAAISSHGRQVLEAYARGVNTYRQLNASRLPLEYRLAGFEPAPWSPVDSLAIAEYMGCLLSFNVREELVFLRLAKRLGSTRALELFPTDEGLPAPEYPQEFSSYLTGATAPSVEPRRTAVPSIGLPLPGPASNSWAVPGTRTRDGQPLLANDPHLSPSTPGIWYELEMKAPGYHAAGLTLPGVPLVLIGHNQDLAWAITTVMADTQDIFLERPTDNGNSVERADGRREAITRRKESIHVRDRQEPVPLAVRSTSNGIIINDILGIATGTPLELVDPGLPYLLALKRNIELPDQTIEGFYRLNRASTVESARDAVRRLSHTSQNIVFAHRNGDLAWQVTGALPLRRGSLGTFPMPAWTGDFGWEGYAPREQNPGGGPTDDVLVTANNRFTDLAHEPHVTRSWLAPFRAQRIREMLSNSNQMTVEAMTAMQLDRTSIEARHLLTALRRLDPDLPNLDPSAWRAVENHLLGWDTRMQPASPSAAFYLLLQAALFEELFGDELGEDLAALESTASYKYHALQEVVRTGRSSFWDDVRTPEQEASVHIWARAIHNAHRELERRQGEPTTARLDRLQRLVFPHAFHRTPLLGRLFDVGPIGIGGGNHTVNVTKSRLLTPETPRFLPSYRVVFTPGQWGATRGTQTLGQSGHRFSPHRTDQLDDWRSGKTHAWHWNGPPPEAVMGTLRLLPERELPGEDKTGGRGQEAAKDSLRS